MISTIINRELFSFEEKINILLSRSEDSYVTSYIKNLFKNSNIVFFDNTYYGQFQPDIVICTNRIIDLSQSINLCKFFHVPLLIIDIHPKSDLITNKIDNSFEFYPIVQIAISEEVYFSWNKIQDYIVAVGTENKEQWKNIIYNMCKETFKIKNISTNNEK